MRREDGRVGQKKKGEEQSTFCVFRYSSALEDMQSCSIQSLVAVGGMGHVSRQGIPAASRD